MGGKEFQWTASEFKNMNNIFFKIDLTVNSIGRRKLACMFPISNLNHLVFSSFLKKSKVACLVLQFVDLFGG
jgi:hypothetical protein